MKRRLIQFVTTYFLFVLIFVLQKPIFMGYYHTLYNKVSWTDYFSVMGHGLPLDFSLAGYLTAIPGLLLIASVWIQPTVIRQIRRGYFMIIAILLSCIFIGDLGLYEYWGFRLDATPLFYLFSSPKDALASVSIWVVRTGRNGCLCGFTLPDILPGTDLSKTTDKNTFSPVECIRSIATCHRPPVHPDTGRFHGVDHEPEQSLLQQ